MKDENRPASAGRFLLLIRKLTSSRGKPVIYRVQVLCSRMVRSRNWVKAIGLMSTKSATSV